MLDAATTLDFRRGGNAAPHLGPGWSDAEPDSRWAIGTGASEFWFEHPGAARDCILEFKAHAFVAPPVLPFQPIEVRVRGETVGRFDLARRTSIGFVVPAALLEAPGPVRVQILHPGAAAPSKTIDSRDDRELAVAFRGATLWRFPAPGAEPLAWSAWSQGLPTASAAGRATTPGDLVMRFESLGDNCEFGLVQRRAGKEPLGLLRFANLVLDGLLTGLSTGFAALSEAKTLGVRADADAKEYTLYDDASGYTTHIFVDPSSIAPDAMLARQIPRLRFLIRKLGEDVDGAEKIFVVKRNDGLGLEEILPLYAALRSRAANRLLWVVPADAAHPPGTVERVLPSLYQAWIERLAPPENAHDLMYGTWLEICRRTAELVDGVPLTLSDAPPEAAPPPAEYVPAMPFVMAGAAPRPRRVVFLGNCQLQSLATLHRLLVPDAETIHVQSYRSATDEGRAAVAGADALVRQVLDFAPAVGDLATTAETLLVPHTTLAFLWPYSGQPHPRNQPAPILDENGPYPGEFGDSFLNRLLLQEVPPDEAARRYLETDVAQVRRVDRLMELVLDKQRDRDRICGFGFADAIAGGFRTEPMFRSANQMERGFALAFAREVFGRMGLDGALLDRLDEVAPQHLSPPTEIPIHPSVAAHFGISYAPPNRRYAFFSEGRFEAPAFWERYMRYEWNPALAEALAALRVRDDARAIPLLIDALARAGRLDEAVVWAAEAVAAEPEIERHRTRLGQLERQRDAARNG